MEDDHAAANEAGDGADGEERGERGGAEEAAAAFVFRHYVPSAAAGEGLRARLAPREVVRTLEKEEAGAMGEVAKALAWAPTTAVAPKRVTEDLRRGLAPKQRKLDKMTRAAVRALAEAAQAEAEAAER